MALFNIVSSSVPQSQNENIAQLKVDESQGGILYETGAATEAGQSQNTKRFIKYLVAFFVALSSFSLFPPSMQFTYVGLCIWALFGPKHSLQAIIFAAFIRYLNPALFTFTSEMGVLSWLILLLAMIRNVPFAGKEVAPKLAPLFLFCLFTAALTVVTSSYVMVSIMKLLSFAAGSLTVLVCCERLNKSEIKSLWLWVSALFTLVICLSLFTLAVPAVAHHRGAGFQGILNHPQALGALIAPFASFLLAGVFFQRKSLISMPVLIASVLVGISVLSETRTAMVAVALSLVSTLILYFISNKRFSKNSSMGKTLAKGAAFLVLFLSVVATYKPAQDVLFSYVLKRESSNVEEALSSRSSGIASQWNHFIAKPIAGWGFGVYPGDNFAKDVHTFMGIPISAPVEKGFMPTAVLEELGFVGALFLIYFLWRITRFVVSTPDIRWAALFFACLFVNLGEFVFFSAGGIGIFYWVLMGLSTVAYKTSKIKLAKS